MPTDPTPWWEAIRLRDEVTAASGSIDDVQMSLFNAVHGVAGVRPPYADAGYYGEITHPGQTLVQLLGRVGVRLAAPSDRHRAAPALYWLSQGMGGGKSHGLIGLWHLAAHPDELRHTEVGELAFAEAERICGVRLPDDLRQPRTVVLACDNMTAGRGDTALDGPAVTLYERFLWRLFAGDSALYNRYQPYHADRGQIANAISAVGRPVLILVDEVMHYVQQLSEDANADLAVRDMAFLRALLRTIHDVPNAAMVVVMISSENDPTALDQAGRERQAELFARLTGDACQATVTSPTDFAAILRRRLFTTPAAATVVDATAKLYAHAMAGAWSERVPGMAAPDFAAEVERCYPFHPSLIAQAEKEWAPIAGFQKVRSTIRIFAATAYVLAERAGADGWVPSLIGPGDLPLSSAAVREAVIGSGLIPDERAQVNYRQLASTDIVGDDDRTGNARLLDLGRSRTLWSDANPRAAERMATALFLHSIIGPRGHGRQGATEAELKAACFVPDPAFTPTDAETTLAEVRDRDTGLAAVEHLPGAGGQPARLFLSTRQTLNMLFRAARNGVSDADRDEELAAAAERLAVPGRFGRKLFIRAQSEQEDPRPNRQILAESGLDEARSTRLVVLDPRRFSLLNGNDEETRNAIRAALGIGPDRLPVQWASSVVFAVANTQRRGNARAHAKSYVAWKRVCDIGAVGADPDLANKAARNRGDAKQDLDKAVKAAYQHVVYLREETTEDGEGRQRVEQEIRLEGENQSSLDGTIVWSVLVERDKAFATGEFGARALLANLVGEDYGRPLDELRDLFWNSPRMPLLPDGDTDLQRAIFQAIREGLLRLVGSDGTDRSGRESRDIAVGAPGLRLARPLPATEDEASEPAGDATTGGNEPHRAGGQEPRGGLWRVSERPGVPTAEPQPAREVQLAFSLNTSLSDNDRRQLAWRLFHKLTTAIDETASHVELTVRVVVPDATAEEMGSIAQSLGSNPTTTDVP